MRDDYVADSAAAGASVAAPGAGATVVSLAAPRAGWYEVTGTLVISGTAAETVAANAAVKVNGANFLVLPTAGQANVPNDIPFRIPRIRLDGTNAVQVVAVGAATALTVYTANLVVTQVS